MARILTAYKAMVTKLILNIPKPGLATNSLPMFKDIPPPLDPKDYPNVHFWTAKAFEAYSTNLTGETDGLCHRRYCSALDSHFIALDVRFVVVYCRNHKALHCVVPQD